MQRTRKKNFSKRLFHRFQHNLILVCGAALARALFEARLGLGESFLFQLQFELGSFTFTSFFHFSALDRSATALPLSNTTS